jgi:hypothetical protein
MLEQLSILWIHIWWTPNPFFREVVDSEELELA